MNFFKYLIFLILFFNLSSVKSDDELLKIKISKNLRCLVCQGQSIYDSDSEFAISLRKIIDNKISAGLSEQEIYTYMENKYGQWILYEPKLAKNTYILWILPILLFFIGGSIIYKYLQIKKNET